MRGEIMKKLLVVALILIAGNTLNAEITFLKGPLAEALRKADQEKKPVMIDFFTDWCRWCDTLDVRTYTDADVAAFVNANVVPIKIDAEKGEGIDIAKRYGVNGYPTILLINSDGAEIDRVLGYVPPKPFLSTLQSYLKGENTIGALTSRLKDAPDDVNLQFAIAQKYSERNDLETASEHFRKILELDQTNAFGHNEEAQFAVATASLHSAKSPAQMELFLNAYPQSPRVRQALATVIKFYVKEKNSDSAKTYFLKYLEKWPADAPMMNNFAWNCAQQRINLDYAAEVAKKAVGLAANTEDKASYIDTYATVRFVQGDVDEAISLEQNAIDLLRSVPNVKMKPFEETMMKFKAAKKSASAN